MPGNFGFSPLALKPSLFEDEGPFDDGNDKVERTEDDTDSEEDQKRRRKRKFEGFVVPRKRKKFHKPSKIVWLNLVFKTNSTLSELLFTYEKPKIVQRTLEDRDGLQKLLIDIHEEKPVPTKPGVATKPPENRGETSLSINGQEMMLVILELPNDSNLRFNRDGAAISTRQEDEEFFREAGVLNTQNPNKKERKSYERVANFSSRRRRSKNKECRLAYFIVDATDKAGQDEDPFPYLFNIHLDMTGPIDGSGMKYYFPIIIDPSVRHPGGGG